MTLVTVTDLEGVRLALLRLVSNDPAAYKEAADFVGDNQLKFELFGDCYNQAHQEVTPLAKALSAVQEAGQRFALIKA